MNPITSLQIVSILLFLNIFNFSYSTDTDYDCRSTTCTCSRAPSKGYEIECPSYAEPMVRVTFTLGNPIEFEVDCRSNLNYTEFLPSSYLPKDSLIQADLFSFKTCNFPPNKTIHDVMSQLQIMSTKTMRIAWSQLSNISRSDFLNLKTLSKLTITNNVFKDIPFDIFYDLENLTNLDFVDNNVTIPRDFFKSSKRLDYLDLGRNRLPKNPGPMFENLKELKWLNIWGMNIEVIDKSLLKNLRKLDTLDISRNSIVVLPVNVFEDLTNLKLLSLSQNQFEELPEGLFTNNTVLNKLYMDYNYNLHSLPPYLLANLTMLTDVSMMGCNISVIPENVFWGATKLINLNMATNNLHTLPDLLFQDMQSLKTLNLKNNKVHTLPDHLFIGFSQLTTLNLENNFIQLTKNSLDGLDNLEELYMRNNEMKLLSRETFNNVIKLTKLDLSYNKLTLLEDTLMDFFGKWSPLSKLGKLKELSLAHNEISDIFADWRIGNNNLQLLDISHNNITAVTFNDLSFLQNEITVNLQHNKITDINLHDAELIVNSIYDTTIPTTYTRKNVQIKIEGNPIHCSCNLYHLTRYFDGTMDPYVRTVLELVPGKLTCASPESMIGIDITKLNSKTLVCELTDETKMINMCVTKNRCYLRPHDKTLIVNASYSGLTEAPEISNETENLGVENVEIDLRGNDLRSLPTSDMGYENVSKMDVSNNMIERLPWIPPKIQVLYLHGNNFTYMNENELNALNKTSIRNVTFYNNPWKCDCNAVNFTKYLQEHFKKIPMLRNVTCDETNHSLTNLSINDLCPVEREKIIFLSILIALLGLIVGSMAALYYRFQIEIKVWLYAHHMCLWFVTEDELDKDKLYDAFISYSHKDEDFVVTELLPNLEEGSNPFKLCLHFRNWQPGEFITANIAKSVAESRRTLVVLSPNFLASEWGKMEFRTAHIQALSEGRARVIVILLGDIGPTEDLDDELRAYLNTNTYIKWGDPWFWDKLKYAMPHAPRFSKQQNIQSTLHKIKIYDDKFDLIEEPSSPLGTTPPADKIHFDPMLKNGVLNVSLVNGTLLFNALQNEKNSKIVIGDR